MSKKTVEEVYLPEEKSQVVPFIIVFVFIGLIISAFFFFDFRQKNSAVTSELNGLSRAVTSENTQSVPPIIEVSGTTKEVTEIVTKVSKHIVLPNGSVTVSTVIDPENLRKDNPDFQLAKQGDKVLLYADRAILYDHSVDLIVDVIHFNK